jgi:hypothetical protein
MKCSRNLNKVATIDSKKILNHDPNHTLLHMAYLKQQTHFSYCKNKRET